jgi:hypothetical protein
MYQQCIQAAIKRQTVNWFFDASFFTRKKLLKRQQLKKVKKKERKELLV